MSEQRHNRNNKGGSCTNQNGGPILGLLLAAGGILIFLKQAGYIVLPSWAIIWPSIMIITGIFLAVTQGFKDMNWMVLVIIGGVFLTNSLFPALQLRQYIVPIILVSVGLSIVFWSIANKKTSEQNNTPTGWFNSYYGSTTSSSPEDFIKINSILSGINKKVTSTNFKGGKISCLLGGVQIDLSQADIDGTAVLNINEVWGGIELIVPPNWQVESNLSVLMGAVEDSRRQYSPTTSVANKILILNGSLLMAGVEIRS